MIRKTLGRYRNRRLLGALVVASTVTAASTIAVVGVPGASAATSSSTPTASINVWMVDNGKNVDNLWAQLASQFDAAHPGDHVNVSITPSSGNTYQVKLLSALGTANPPALFFSWGGGALQQYIQAGKAQPIGDAGMTDAGKPTWTKDFLPSSLGPVTFNGKLYGIPILGTQPVLFFYNKTVLAKYHLGFPQTLPQLLSDVKTLASHNTTLIGLGNLDNWEGLMYLEYFADRAGGPRSSSTSRPIRRAPGPTRPSSPPSPTSRPWSRTRRSRPATTRSVGATASSTPSFTREWRRWS